MSNTGSAGKLEQEVLNFSSLIEMPSIALHAILDRSNILNCRAWRCLYLSLYVSVYL